MNECIGCQLSIGQLPVHVVFENEFVYCILDHDPFSEGHTLILPKEHVEDVDTLNIQTAHAIMEALMLIANVLNRLFQPDGITINQNGGVFNELTHYMHVVPRYENQSFQEFYSDEPLKNEKLKSRLEKTKLIMRTEIGNIYAK